MDLRTPVKKVLRHCGHALVSTVHDRLNVVDRLLQEVLDQNTHLAGTQTALLQSGIHLVENVAQTKTEMHETAAHLSAEMAQLRDFSASKADIQALTTALEQMREIAAGKAEIEALSERVAVLQEVVDQNVHLATTQTALLQSEAHLVEGVDRIQAEIRQVEDRVTALVRAKADTETLQSIRAEMQRLEAQMQRVEQQFHEGTSANLETLETLKNYIEAVNGRIEHVQDRGGAAVESGVEKMLTVSEAIRHSTEETFSVLRPVAYETRNFLVNQSVRQVCVETSDYLSTNPEIGLFKFLYSYLPSRIALDIGAHVGDVSEYLLKAGFEVYAFEPYPKSYRRLKERLGSRPEFHSLNLALGSMTGEAPLYLTKDSSPDNRYEDATVFHSLAPHGMPEDLSFTGTVSVKVRRLADLHKDGLVPSDAGLVKIDTEGYDLEVVRGMDEYRYPVVAVEFWDTQIPFGNQGLLYTVDSMAAEMRQRGYLWYIVIYRVWGQNETAFFCNYETPVPNSWGNIIFFRDHDIFAQAQHWCSAVLPRTYFRHVAVQPELSAQAAM